MLQFGKIMCYLIYFSTTAPDELAAVPSEHYRLAPLCENDDPRITALLRHPNRWFLESKYGSCSCHFRHWSMTGAHEFMETADWMEEDPENIEATTAVYDLMARLVADRHQADVLCIWNGDDPEDVTDLTVSLGAVARQAFMFFEDYRFAFVP